MRVESRGSRDSWRPTTRLNSCVSPGVRARNILARPSQLHAHSHAHAHTHTHTTRHDHASTRLCVPSLIRLLGLYYYALEPPLKDGRGSRRTNRTLQPTSTRLLLLLLLLNPLLPFLQTQQPCVALATLMLRAHQCADHGAVRHLGQSLLVRLNLSREAVQLGPVDLLLR
jgi:hypothetical protein